MKDIENELEQQSRKKEKEENFLPKLKESQRCFEETFKEIEKKHWKKCAMMFPYFVKRKRRIARSGIDCSCFLMRTFHIQY